MKINKGFMLRNVAKMNIVVPIAQNTLNYKGMLSLNETGAFLWSVLVKGATEEELLQAMLNEYDVEPAVASADIREFLDHIRSIGALTE